MKQITPFLLFIFWAVLSCSPGKSEKNLPGLLKERDDLELLHLPFDTGTNSIHVFVALCDNKYQGIVPVPAKIGNGQDPDNNLYWGWGYGVRTYFKKSNEWKFIESRKIDSMVLERLIFKHVTKNYYLIADAYDGRYIKNCTVNFLNSLSGQKKDSIHVKDQVIGIIPIRH